MTHSKLKQFGLRVLILSLVVLMLVPTFAGCGKKNYGKPYMTLGQETLTINMYELMLTRMKGQMSYYNYPVGKDSFWDTIADKSGETYATYFEKQIQDQCKNYLVSWYLFEEEYGLALPQSTIEEVDNFLTDLLYTDANGSKSAFNSILSTYGVNYDILREVYLIEAKIAALRSHLSTLISDNVRDQYYQDHYVCFKKLVLSSYYLVYEQDDQKDDIYYTDDGYAAIAYDKEKGETKKDSNGNTICDKFNDAVYFLPDGHIAYDTVKGVRNNVDQDGDSVGDYVQYSQEELEKIAQRAGELYESAQTMTNEEFDTLAKENSSKYTASDSGNGSFLNRDGVYSSELLDDLATGLADKKAGDTVLVTTGEGYYILRVLPLPENGRNEEANTEWFSDLENYVVDEMLDTLSSKWYSEIVIDVKSDSKKPSIKNVGTNWLGTMFY